jgi:hypothetical protein
MSRRLLLLALVALGSLAASCGGEDQATQSRQPSAYPATTRPITPASDVGPPPQNMPGGGRGSDPPHFKGKP